MTKSKEVTLSGSTGLAEFIDSSLIDLRTLMFHEMSLVK